jgi:hypothetical protein
MNEAKSILIDRGNNDKILVNNAFFDSAVMILKYDGANNDNLFILANQNIILDLDVEAYLKSKIQNINKKDICPEVKTQNESNIEKIKLTNGKTLEIFDLSNSCDFSGLEVTINGENPGNCNVEGNSIKYYIREGKIIKKRYLKKVRLSNGTEILIEQNYKLFYSSGDFIYILNKPAPSGKYKLGFLDYIRVVDGVIK